MFSDPIVATSLVIIGLVFGVILGLYFLRFPSTLLFVTLATFVADTLLGQGALSIQAGTYTISIMDLLSFFLIGIGIMFLLLNKEKMQIPIILILVLGSLLFISWLRGLGIYGIESATNAFRPYLYFFANLFFLVSLKITDKLFDQATWWLGLTGWALIIIALIRWVLLALGLASSPDWISSSGWMVRVIFAAPTFFLLQITILQWSMHKKPWKIPFSKLMPYFFVPAIFILEHRTVWVILVSILMLMLVLDGKIRGTVGIILFLMFAATIFIFQWQNAPAINLSNTSFDLTNFNWRLLGWQALISPERYQSSFDLFIGQPFGTGYARYITGITGEITASPHNFYVQTFLNVGSFGLLILFLLYGITIKSLWVSRWSDELSKGFIALLVAQLIFYITYSPGFEQGLILGLALLYSLTKNCQSKI